MNDLFSSSFAKYRTSRRAEVEMDAMDRASGAAATPSFTGGGGGVSVNLDKFFEDVECVKEDLREVEEVHRKLKSAHEESKILHNAKAVKELRANMERDVSQALKKAKLIKVRLEALDRSNAANRNVPGCGPGTSADRTRTSVVSGLRKKLKEKMDEFQELRQKINSEYKETIQRRYYTVTGENPDEKTVDLLISTGESETFLQKAIQEQGRGRIVDTIAEIQERHDAVRDMERNLMELHQVFMDMAVMVEHQGEQLDDIEAQVLRASSFVRGGTENLHGAKTLQRNTRKWTCLAIIILLVIILIVVLSLKPWEK